MTARRGALRFGLGLADQLLYSLTNFALTIAVARAVSTAQFGSFALTLATFLILSATNRGLTSEVLLVKHSGASRAAWRDGASQALSASLLFGIALAVVVVAASAFLGAGLRTVILLFGLLLPGLFVQDGLRYAAISRGAPTQALRNDGIVAVLMLIAYLALGATGHISVPTMVLTWGLSSHVAAVYGYIALGLRLSATNALTWIRNYKGLSSRFAADNLATQASQQGATYAVAVASGLADAAQLRGAQTIFSPPSILALGVTPSATAELVRVLETSTTRMHTIVVRIGLALSGVGILWGAAAFFCPDSWGVAVFGATWPSASRLIPYFAVVQAFLGFGVAAAIGLRALAAGNRVLHARAIAVCLGLIVSVAGAIADGATGIAIGMAITAPVQAAVWWWQFTKAKNEYRKRQSRQRVADRWQLLLESRSDVEPQGWS